MDFKNTLIIMTSNVGSSVIEKGGGGLGFQLDTSEEDSSYNRIKTLVNEELKQYFRPEFLNRCASALPAHVPPCAGTCLCNRFNVPGRGTIVVVLQDVTFEAALPPISGGILSCVSLFLFV